MEKINTDLCETHTIGRRTREWIVSPKACPALAGHGISLCGVSDAAFGFRFVRGKPPMTQLLACLCGEGRVWVGGNWLHCRPGQAYLTPPGAMHAYCAVRSSRWRLAWVHWMAMEVAGPALVPMDAPALASAIDGLYRESISAADAAIMQTWATLVALLSQRAVGRLLVDARLQELWRAVDGRLGHAWTSDELSQELGVSSEHLRRLCVAQLGMSPMRYLTRLRMRRADSLLRTGAYAVEAVARLVGYRDPFAFSTAFRRQFGTPPSRIIPRM